MRIQAFAIAIGLLPPPAWAAGEQPIDLCDFKPVMNEDFAHFLVSPHVLAGARWTAHTPWNGDFGEARFSDPGPSGPFAVKDGALTITASRDAQGRWRSGLIAAADPSGAGTGVRDGYFEARMKFPPGPGVWPAFWLATLKPVGEASPSVEIDAVEYYGHADAAFQSALHVWDKGKDQGGALHQTAVAPGSLTAAFHNYGVRVAPDEITYYLDGRPIWRQPTPKELTWPLYPLVDLALGSGFPIDRTPNPSTLTVQYVRVYASDPAGRRGRCPK